MNSKLIHACLMTAIVMGLFAGAPLPARADTAGVVPTADFGDAPDSTNTAGSPMTAYTGVGAQFPTARQAGIAPAGPLHRNGQVPYVLGRGVTGEEGADVGVDLDGSTNIIPVLNESDRDGRDDGFVPPTELQHCTRTQLQVAVTSFDIGQSFPQTAYINVWADFDRSGQWSEVKTCPGGAVANEWVVQNYAIRLAAPGTQIITLPAAVLWNEAAGEDMWLRVTLSESAAPSADGSGPADGYAFGETEDYLAESLGSPAPPATLPPYQPGELIADIPFEPVFLPLVTTLPPGIPHGPGDVVAPSGKIQEVDIAHIGGGIASLKPLVVTVAGTGASARMTSWNVSGPGAAPVPLKEGPILIGHDHKLHMLTPTSSPKLAYEMMVSGLIQDGTLWLSTWRVDADGTFHKLDTRGYGPNAGVSVDAYTFAHRPLVINSNERRFQLVTPILHNGSTFRMVTWEVNGVSGVINGRVDSGAVSVGAGVGTDLSAAFGPGDGNFMVPHFNVSLRTQGGTLINLFWEVTAAGVPTLRGSSNSGLNIRGSAPNDDPSLPSNNALSVVATNVAIAPLADTGFVAAVNLPGNALRMHTWENLTQSCNFAVGGCQFAPSNISDNSLDLNLGGPGIQQPLPVVTSQRVMLRDPLYQEDVYSKNPDQVQAIASVRKVMVAIVALETEDDGFISMDDDVTISPEAAAVALTGASNMGLVEDEVISMRNLMYGNLMVSAGDATWAISEETGATVEGMVGLMNLKANDLGLANTTYCTEGNGQQWSSVAYSTARDQALLWESVYDDPEFLAYAGEDSRDVCGKVNGADFCHPAIPPMTKNMNVYPNTDGHKTGNGGGLCTSLPQFDTVPTCPSGGCVSGQATRLSRPLVVSVLQPSGQPGNRWPDFRNLLDFGFRQIFTPDFRGSSGSNGGPALDFGIDYVSETHGLSVATTGDQRIVFCNWNMFASGSSISKGACTDRTVTGLATSTRVVPPTTLELNRISTLEADGDYLLGRRENGILVMRLWRVGEHD